MMLIIDNYDSFVYNLYQMLGEYVDEIRVVRNDAITVEEIAKLAPAQIVLSPGPGWPSAAGICEDVIKNFAGKIPLLGVCLGHQALCEVAGGKIVHSKEKMHGKTSRVFYRSSPLFQGLSASGMLKVARYHSLAVDKSSLPPSLEVLATAEDDEVMAVQLRTDGAPAYGVQFHPESILTDEGATMLKNFVTEEFCVSEVR